jgi:hypothetical protein
MLLYHINFGFPFLSPCARVILPSLSVEARDNIAEAQIQTWNRVNKPVENAGEAVFVHELAADEDGQTFAALVNDELKIGVRLEYAIDKLPRLVLWKSMVAGDYALGLEPTNAGLKGRGHHLANGEVEMLPAQAQKAFELRITIFEGEEEIRAAEDRASRLVKA